MSLNVCGTPTPVLAPLLKLQYLKKPITFTQEHAAGMAIRIRVLESESSVNFNNSESNSESRYFRVPKWHVPCHYRHFLKVNLCVDIFSPCPRLKSTITLPCDLGYAARANVNVNDISAKYWLACGGILSETCYIFLYLIECNCWYLLDSLNFIYIWNWLTSVADVRSRWESAVKLWVE